MLDVTAGLAVRRATSGTLGAALSFPAGPTFFTAARHVAGGPATTDQAVSIYRSTGTPSASDDLLRLTAQNEPGDDTALSARDLAFLLTPANARNVTPDGSAPNVGIGVVVPGDTLHIRGALHDDWRTPTYLAHFSAAIHGPYFAGLSYAASDLGVIDLTHVGDASGNSGSALWIRRTNAYELVGHLLAVSLAAPLGLIVRYRGAFESLGLSTSCVAQGVWP